jgi:DNA-binding response OmpR family regulator
VNILVVDDDRFANSIVQYVLTKEGHEVELANDPREAFQKLNQGGEPDLLILDVTMPYMNGFEFTAQLRQQGYRIPIIFLTAKDTIEAKVHGFNLGADDYICKPYNHQELVVRVEALRRRLNATAGATLQPPLQCGQMKLLPKELKVKIAEREPIMLTSTEMKILRFLILNAGKIVKRDELLKEVWHDEENNSNIVDVYIRRLRIKLEIDPDKPQYIISLRGIGYKFVRN